MKSYTIDIHPELKNVRMSVKNGAAFERDVISGKYAIHYFEPNEHDIKRIKQFAIKHGDDKRTYGMLWHAHCNGYAMGLTVMKHSGDLFTYSINTYRNYGRNENKNI